VTRLLRACGLLCASASTTTLVSCLGLAPELLPGDDATAQDGSSVVGDSGPSGRDGTTTGDGATDGGRADSSTRADAAPAGDSSVGADATRAPEASSCSSGVDCTPDASCQGMAIVCASGSAVCTAEGPKVNGTPCGPSLYCDNGACLACAEGVDCAPSGAPCDKGLVACTSGHALCNDQQTPAPDGQSCGTNEVCDNGKCVTCAANVGCIPANPCHIGLTSCASGTSTCVDTGNAQPDLTACTGSDACNQNYACKGGVCAGSNPVVCPASDSCHGAGVCTATTGVCSNPPLNGTRCDDGNSCTQSDTCVNGTCMGTAITCSASDVCHAAGTCSGGVCSEPVKADGTICGSNASCQNAVCSCDMGYVLSGSCVVENECADGTERCGGVGGTCSKTAGVVGYTCTCAAGFINSGGTFPQCYKQGSIVMPTYTAYDFATGTLSAVDNLQDGDFYFLGVSPAIPTPTFDGNNGGQQGVQEVTSTAPLLSVPVPTGGYGVYANAVVGGTYIAPAQSGEVDYYIVFRVTAVSTASVSLTYVYVYRP
jgi:hypothetical protein